MSRNRPRILSVASALPPYRIGQEEVKDFARAMFADAHPDIERLLPLFDNAQIEHRYFCVPREWFEEDHSFPEKNALYVEHALGLSEKAARRALGRAGAEPSDVGAIFFVSTTGLATPSLDSKLIFSLGLSPHVRRVPIWGLGCVGGAAGVARAADYARAHPDQLVLLVGVELCGLTFQRGDLSKSNLVATSLFADGAAAAVLGAGDGPELLGSYATTWPGTEDVMGWELVDSGLRVRFAKSVPAIVEQRMRENMERACGSLDLALADIRHYVLHPGGAKVLAAYEKALNLEPGALDLSRTVLRECGNMSSVSVLFVLERFMQSYPAGSGEPGSISALGPGFSAEHVVFRC